MLRTRFKTQLTTDFNDISMNDYYVFSYYLYVICDSISEDDEETDAKDSGRFILWIASWGARLMRTNAPTG